MRLKHIKLAGFKSFVDATTVPFPDQMTAIVGPNGCGKSNVIDAVRWVLGESSAKNLRGDAMTDVIFNGSSRRKPVSQASVELVFDNTEGRLEGNLADRVEISVKRQVNKEAQSTYFLNGTKCRRRDITDIFLGTGLGPRSYAIIEQGMISRLIESKPQELRVFIEEAAGISKYKERRRETENRIKHTRENLLRLEDVREELGTQLEKLKRQSATAKRYKELKGQERKFKAELYALKWHKYNEQLNLYEKERLEKETQLEAFISEQRGGELGMLQYKQQHQTLSDKVQQIQQYNFQISNQVTKLEQQIVFAAENRQKQEDELVSLTATLEEASQHIELEQETLCGLEETLEQLQPEQELLAEQQAENESLLDDAEARFEIWQKSWEKQQKVAASASQNIQVVRTKIQSHQQQIGRLEQRLKDIRQETEQLNAKCGETDLESLQQVLSSQQSDIKTIQSQLDAANAEFNALNAQFNLKQQEFLELTQNANRLSHQLENLTQWQQEHSDEIIGQTDSALDKQQIVNRGPLISQLKVMPKWHYAFEVLLSHLGHPILVSQLPKQPIKGQFVEAQSLSIRSGSVASLVEKGEIPALLNDIGFAETIADAQQAIQLGHFPTMLTLDGSWLGTNWLNHGAIGQNSEQGVLKRLAQIEQLQNQINVATLQRDEFEQELKQASQNRDEWQSQVGHISTQLNNAQTQLAETHLQVKLAEQAVAQHQTMLTKLTTDQSQAELELETEQEIVWQLEDELELVEAQNLQHGAELDELSSAKHELTEQMNLAKQQLDISKEQKHQLALKLQNLTSQISSVKSNLQRALTHQTQLSEKANQLQQTLSLDHDPSIEYQAQLEDLLEQKLEREAELSETQAQLAEVAQHIAELERGQSGVLAKLDKMRSEIESIKLDSEGARVRAQNMLETLNDLEQPLKPVLENMPADAEENEWAMHLEKTTNAITRLGAINLAAIEEYELQAERKGYLDEQFNDLTSALDTLESAIKKIDRESRAKFKQTFEQVNADLQMLFPKVFGGGSAYLELTADDMLDTGVTIMARPPGKKNSTIHLLSGGEKALTALSLVFSIFRLNPAPFCMLDEVDAPLDDANVGRFCNLVKEMSESVQFIYISHNKVAMEMATHLTGVTMQEPGVSRLVAVDIQEAVKMAEAS